LARISAPFVAAAVVVFVLQQIQVESPAEEEAPESGCLLAGESPQAGRAPPPRLAAAEAVSLLEELPSVEKPKPLPNELLKLHPPPSRNTSAGVADK